MEASKRPRSSGDGSIVSETPSERGRRNRVRPNNWGYSTYIDAVFAKRCFFDLVRLEVFRTRRISARATACCRRPFGGGWHRAGPLSGASRRAPRAMKGVLCICVGDGASARTAPSRLPHGVALRVG